MVVSRDEVLRRRRDEARAELERLFALLALLSMGPRRRRGLRRLTQILERRALRRRAL